MLQEIEERKKIEKELSNSENKFRSLHSSMTEGVALHDVIYDEHEKAIDYTIKEINPAYESITGLSREQAVGCRASELYGTATAPYLEIYGKVADTGEST